MTENTASTTTHPNGNDEFDRYITIWSKAVETQMHFNEMSVKSRQLGLTFVAAALGIGLVLVSRKEDFSFTPSVFGCEITIHVVVILLLVAWAALSAVKRLDLNVYHRMLRGAVAFGEDLEENYMKKIVALEKGMTQAVSHFSRYDDAEIERASDSDKYKYKGYTKITAEKKIRKFYNAGYWFLGVSAFSLLIITNL